LNEKVLRILGIVATAAGIGVNILASWVSDKKLDQELNKKVAKALENKN
jgi:hypothetical protein